MEKEFMQAFDEYGDAIFRFCFLKVSEIALAEDMTQETFMRYWQALRRGQEMTNTRSFLYTIAGNLAKDWYKKKKSDSLDYKMEQGFEPRERETRNAQILAEYQEAITKISALGERDREVLFLRYTEGLDPKDIADILGESANAVSVRLSRAMKHLQKELGV